MPVLAYCKDATVSGQRAVPVLVTVVAQSARWGRVESCA